MKTCLWCITVFLVNGVWVEIQDKKWTSERNRNAICKNNASVQYGYLQQGVLIDLLDNNIFFISTHALNKRFHCIDDYV